MKLSLEEDILLIVIRVSQQSTGSVLKIECVTILTLMPSNLDRALRGLRARRVLRDLMAVKSEYPSEFATRLIKDTCREHRKTSRLGESENEFKCLCMLIILV